MDPKDDFFGDLNPLDDQQITGVNMKQVGNSMFIINNREASPGRNNEVQTPSASAFATSLKGKIQQCAQYAEKKPAMRKKLVESMLDLEHQLNEVRAEEGFIGQMKAQQRVKQTMQAEKEKYERDVEKLLELTAVLDSAVRAVGL